jgi:hypothetical protein
MKSIEPIEIINRINYFSIKDQVINPKISLPPLEYGISDSYKEISFYIDRKNKNLITCFLHLLNQIARFDIKTKNLNLYNCCINELEGFHAFLDKSHPDPGIFIRISFQDFEILQSP